MDAEGQSGDTGPSPAQVEPDLKALSKMLERNGVDKHANIQWQLARATLKNATGMPTLVGVATGSDRAAAARSAPSVAQSSSD